MKTEKELVQYLINHSSLVENYFVKAHEVTGLEIVDVIGGSPLYSVINKTYGYHEYTMENIEAVQDRNWNIDEFIDYLHLLYAGKFDS